MQRVLPVIVLAARGEAEDGMPIYVVRKRDAQWSVCARSGALVQFDDYTEAVEVARLAADVMAERHRSACAGERPEGRVRR
jgi:hypothetical protein